MSNDKLREFSEWLDTYRDLPVHEVFHEIVLRYEEALATTEPVMANGLTEAETDASASVVGLATTAPAVNQQLTTEPFDEREAFEREMSCEEIWGHRSFKKKPDGRYANWCVDLMWDVWKARAAMAKGVKG